jgi:hypothetical protein
MRSKRFSARHDQSLCVSDGMNVPCRKRLSMECWMKFCCTVDPVNSPTHVILFMDPCPIVCLPLLCLPFTERFLTPGYMKSSTGENKPMLNRQLTSIGAVSSYSIQTECPWSIGNSFTCALHWNIWQQKVLIAHEILNVEEKRQKEREYEIDKLSESHTLEVSASIW